jgi:hypothetical protein
MSRRKGRGHLGWAAIVVAYSVVIVPKGLLGSEVGTPEMSTGVSGGDGRGRAAAVESGFAKGSISRPLVDGARTACDGGDVEACIRLASRTRRVPSCPKTIPKRSLFFVGPAMHGSATGASGSAPSTSGEKACPTIKLGRSATTGVLARPARRSAVRRWDACTLVVLGLPRTMLRPL